MTLPIRSEKHIVESDSLKILKSQLPREWVVRELNERDYGVDLYVEIVTESNRLSGDLVAIQLKGTKNVTFKNKRSSFGGIKRETLNYWLSLTVPVFVCVACLEKKQCYWGSIELQNRQGRFKKKSKTVSVALSEESSFSPQGLQYFYMSYAREKSWTAIEKSIEKSLMLYNTLGPLVLMCERGRDDATCTTTLQYLVNQHYEHHVLLSKYLLWKRPKSLSHWYEKNNEYTKTNNLKPSGTMCYRVLKDLFGDTLRDYRACMLEAHEMVMETQAHYFSERFPFLHKHLKDRPHTFLAEDWYSRFFFDEYEKETAHPERLYFEDFDVFDNCLNELIRS